MLELEPDDERMRLRYTGTCRPRGRSHDAGADAIYGRALKAIRRVECDTPAAEGPVVEVAGGDVGAHSATAGSTPAVASHRYGRWASRGLPPREHAPTDWHAPTAPERLDAMTTAPQTFEPDGRAISYIDEGAGPALVLITETGQEIGSLGTLASILVEEDFRVVRLAAFDPSDDVHALARTVVDVMDAVGVDHAWIGGHGFGGTVARMVPADHHDRVNGVLLMAPEEAEIPLAADIPVLVIHGTDDDVTPLAVSERLVASAPALASLKTVDGAGHLFPATHPGETSWFIEDYLDWD